jgi:hypothetical protein
VLKGISLLLLVAGSVSATPFLSFSANADTTIPANYTGPPITVTDGFDYSGIFTASGGSGAAWLYIVATAQGTILTGADNVGQASLSVSLGSSSIWIHAPDSLGYPAEYCRSPSSGGDTCLLPIAWGQPQVLTIHGTARSGYAYQPADPFLTRADQYPIQSSAELSMSVGGVGSWGPNGFQLTPNATLSFGPIETTLAPINTAPEPATVSLGLTGLLLLAVRRLRPRLSRRRAA